MNKILVLLFRKVISKYRIMLTCFALVVILCAIGYLAWLNHNDFEKAITRQVQTQLLITALSEAQSIERYIDDTKISVPQINSLVKHINDLERVYVFIIDNNAEIISHPCPAYVGKNILTLAKGRISGPDWLKLNAIMRKIRNGQEGSDILDFFSEDADPKIAKTLVAFAPIRIGKTKGSIIAAMEYSVIANPINKNLRDTFLFIGFINLSLVIFGMVLYKIRKEKEKLTISEMVSNIINKQLRLEIDERKGRGQKPGRRGADRASG
ncbi:MAG: hypothetical protein WC510_03380 [Candidatus Omnitrophota bacterium]